MLLISNNSIESSQKQKQSICTQQIHWHSPEYTREAWYLDPINRLRLSLSPIINPHPPSLLPLPLFKLFPPTAHQPPQQTQSHAHHPPAICHLCDCEREAWEGVGEGVGEGEYVTVNAYVGAVVSCESEWSLWLRTGERAHAAVKSILACPKPHLPFNWHVRTLISQHPPLQHLYEQLSSSVFVIPQASSSAQHILPSTSR